jgi:hypothetical protein
MFTYPSIVGAVVFNRCSFVAILSHFSGFASNSELCGMSTEGNYLPQRHREHGVSDFFKIFRIPELRDLCVSVLRWFPLSLWALERI